MVEVNHTSINKNPGLKVFEEIKFVSKTLDL